MSKPGIEPYRVPCVPPWYARGGHGQTLWGHVLPSRGPFFEEGPERVREVNLTGGDRLRVFERPGRSGLRVLLFHGLSGDANADYMRRAAHVLGAAGHSIWSVNHRGCGIGKGLARGAYHSGRAEDMAAVLGASRARDPGLKQLVIGFSLSGNIALLLAGLGREEQPDALIAVNPPVDIGRTSVDISRGLSRLYERRFIWRLKRDVRARESAGLTRGSYRIPAGSSLVDFDNLFTAPECGFKNAADYYHQCSSLQHLGKIQQPGVILSAADDPFVKPLVYRGIPISESVHLHMEQSGGHIGYLSRDDKGGSRWIDAALLHYVTQLNALLTDST